MMMRGNRSNDNLTTYRYGTYDNNGHQQDDRLLTRQTWGDGDNHMYNGELSFTHKFNEQGTHKLDASVSFNRWSNDGSNEYLTDTLYVGPAGSLGFGENYSYQYRPQEINNRNWEAKIEYENKVSERLKLEAGYNGRFIYDNDIHALYATANMKFGRLGVMTGLRGEYWKVDTRSIDYYQQEEPFKKDYFQLFPSLFLNYELTESSQIQLNYTRRLRRAHPEGQALAHPRPRRAQNVLQQAVGTGLQLARRVQFAPV